ncbi:MAG: hypothetical protein BWK76_24740 [Desulfobulbaceae bacterium A2]|nr:MAG: hypothetical protein BWK76_24740 [Desulfobulbaceae bacterium A2]
MNDVGKMLGAAAGGKKGRRRLFAALARTLAAACMFTLLAPMTSGVAGNADKNRDKPGWKTAAQYRYQLESPGSELCEHMTKVFNQHVIRPWYVDPDIPYEDFFERLPEFEAVKWREWQIQSSPGGGSVRLMPILVAELDIDNDGVKDWVVQHQFLYGHLPPENFIMPNGNYTITHGDGYAIFPAGGLDLTMPLSREHIFHGQISGHATRMLGFPKETAQQLFFFVSRGKTYLAAYRPYWIERVRGKQAKYPDDFYPHWDEGPQDTFIKKIKHTDDDRHSEFDKKVRRGRLIYPEDFYPDREYFDVLQVLPGGYKHFDYEGGETANYQTVCRIRMIRLYP